MRRCLGHCKRPKWTRRGAETKLVLPGLAPQKDNSRCDPALIKAIARGRAWFEEFVSGRARSLQELAKRDGISRHYIRRLIGLAFLSPELIEAILQGPATRHAHCDAAERTRSAAGLDGAAETARKPKPQLRTDICPRPRPHRGRASFAVRTFGRWDCINARQRERARESRFAACASLLTSPATRRPPPKCGAFRL
jgi:hypothetical protein